MGTYREAELAKLESRVVAAEERLFQQARTLGDQAEAIRLLQQSLQQVVTGIQGDFQKILLLLSQAGIIKVEQRTQGGLVMPNGQPIPPRFPST